MIIGVAGARCDDVKVGVIAPLTGGLANGGADIVNTLKLFEERLATSSSPWRLHFVIEDGKCGLGNDATTAAKRSLNLQRIRFLITGCSGETLQAAPHAQRAHAVLFAVLSTHPAVREQGEYVFRNYPDIKNGLREIVLEMQHDGRHRVAVLTEDNTFTKGMKNILLAELGEAVATADDFIQDTEDYRTLLLKVLTKKPDAIYLC